MAGLGYLCLFALVPCLAGGVASGHLQLESSGSIAEQCNFTSPAFKPEIMEQIQELFRQEVRRQRYLGESPNYAATSCAEIEEIRPCLLPGLYWMETSNGTTRVNCTTSNYTQPPSEQPASEWRSVANVDMTRDTQCPTGLEMFTETVRGKRLCRGPNLGSGCSSTLFSVGGTQYSQVRGKVVGYQFFSTNAFYVTETLEKAYVDGVSITHGNPRNHIWTLAAGYGETNSYAGSQCPCAVSAASQYIETFIGEDYYCDIGNSGSSISAIIYIDNPLWDGEGCGPTSNCCDNPDLPWFTKELPQPTTDDIELRICRDEYQNNEDVLLEVIELYVK